MPLTHISKVSALTILALSIAACSSGGNHTKISPNTPPLTDQAAAQKIEANRLALLDKAKKAGLSAAQAAAYAEANKEASETDAQSALNTLVAEKAEADRIAAEKAAAEKAEADRIAAEKAEADRIAAEKAAAEKAEADRIAAEKAAAEKAEADRIAAEKAEADRIAAEKAEADRIAAEKAEAERLQKIEDNRLALLDKAKTAGLTDQQAADYAEANKESDTTTAQTALDTLIVNIEKTEIANAKGISDSVYPIGSIRYTNTGSSKATINAYTKELTGKSVIYNQKYSVILGDYTRTLEYNNQTGMVFSDNTASSIVTKGIITLPDAIPVLGTATYTGTAFTSTNYGNLKYTVNFSDRTGSGSITGFDAISLDKGYIAGTGITSTAQQAYNSGTYSLDFYGKKAEEIAGKVIFNGKDTIGFGGTRGEISK